MRYLQKIPPLLLVLLFMLLAGLTAMLLPVGYLPSLWHLLVVLVLALFGLVFCIAGVLCFRQARTTVNPLQPEGASQLVTSGIYRYSRNPMYVGFVLLLLAWCAVLGSVHALFWVFCFIAYLHRFQIRREERALQQIFGAEFDEYCKRVGRWL